MKKFTLIMTAALAVVVSWAQPPSILSGSEPFAYDDMRYGDAESKTVPLGVVARELKVIGVKIIYTAKGEANGSGISWFEIPQLVTVSDGLEVKEYPTFGEAHDEAYNNYTSERVSRVAIDGSSIFIANTGTGEVNILPPYLAAITGAAKDAIADGRYFDLQGRRVDTPKKGLYIVNGKKVMVK